MQEIDKQSRDLMCFSFARYYTRGIKDKYENYKNGKQDSSNEDLKSMKILSILERLGYPMDQMGTYLYEEVISSACESLASVTGARRDMELCKDILSQLKNCFSSFYRNIAREYLEMGIQSFHFMIEQSIKDIQA